MRIKGYDYTRAGAYFVTICAAGRACLFGDIVAEEMRLTAVGEVAASVWQALPLHFPDLFLGSWVVMPNHFHGIVVLGGRAGEASATASTDDNQTAADASPLPHGTAPGSLGAVVQNFKAVSTRKINRLRGTAGAPVWQRNYWERIIRRSDERELTAIEAYIRTNPANWNADKLHIP